MNKVAVLMSTYNGEKYILEQIQSIIEQMEVEVHLYIRDDGSKDDTVGVIKSFMVDHTDISLEKGENVGVGSSFMNLVYSAGEYDYYAFADQDDIWLPDKLIKAISNIEKETGAVLYTSNQIIVNDQLEKTGIRYSNNPNTSYRQIICQNKFAGCTMVWNKKFQKIIADPDRRPSDDLLSKRIHDVWFAMVAAVTDGLIYDDNGYILYRQHENNVVGVRKTNILKQWMSKIKDPGKRNGRSALCDEILKCYSDIIKDENIKEYLSMVANYRQSLKKSLKLIKHGNMCEMTGEKRIMFVMKTLAGLI